MTDCYDYVRRTYGVPACVGLRVVAFGRPGVIVATRTQLHYVHVRWDGERRSVPVHPTDPELEYLRHD